jgi:predicted nucleic acid-binding Zn ribbon protein
MRRLSNMLQAALARDEVLRAARAQKILKEWPALVGASLATRSHPDRYDHGTVWVAVESSTWAQELRMNRETILARLSERSGEANLFQDIRFGVRPIRREDPIVNEPLEEDDTYKQSLKGLSIREIAERRLKQWGSPEAPES